jgi:glycosyltransferase involved in cell wall biosynthesis
MPTVSIVLPTLNERGHLRDCLDSLLAQQTGDAVEVVEVLVVDGGSTDGTREVVEEEGGVVRLLDNPRVTAAAAMNVGIAAAVGEVVCRADAHTVYAPDYVRRCVEVLEETGAANVGGPMVPVGTTTFGRAVAAVTTSPFGVGPGRFHYATGRMDVETVYLGCWRRQTLVEAGGYDEEHLQWAAEDQELNFRLRQAGGRIVLDSSIRSWYFPRATPRALLRQYRNYGLAKASTLAKHKTLPYWRPVAPALLVGATVAAPVVVRPWWLKLAPPLAWLVGASVVSARLSKDPGVAPHRVLGALAICHWGYGVGLWAGLWRIVTGRPFDTRPVGGR